MRSVNSKNANQKMLKIILAIILISCDLARCNLREDIWNRIQRIKTQGKKLYGDTVKTEWTVWELENDDMTGYPRGDNQKKALFHQQWVAYYECSARQLDTILASGRLPSRFVAAYEGTVARLQCDRCISPEEDDVKWFYAKSLKEDAFNVYEGDQNTIKNPDGTMTLYSTQMSNALVYSCHTSLLVLHVTTDPYTLVKPPSSNGPYPSGSVTEANVTVWTKWGPWSDCSRCDVVGRKRRYGMCFVTVQFDKNGQTSWNDTDIEIFKDFPGGIPCGSEYLPESIQGLAHVMDRKNEIMLAMCKVPCRDEIFELRLPDGRVIERDNNSAGEYSLLQTLPPQPPMPVAQVLFVDSEDSLVLNCPGSAFTDTPLTWRVGTKIASPEALARDSDGLIYIDARDRIVFTKLKEDDANVYSCWVGTQAIGTVKLHVWSGPQRRLERDTILLIVIILLVNIMSLLRSTVKSARNDLELICETYT